MSGAVCAILASGSLLISPGSFTLAWSHSVQHIRWEEDWQVEQGLLVLREARVRGTGAGMEIPAGAEFRDGAWHYQPGVPPLHELRLANSPHGGGYEVCQGVRCVPLAQDGQVAVFQACAQGPDQG
ncbi:MAG TPA: DUF1850 domain-containing protein [Rhodocyclaceae bacterium]|nr:DUF1850 domain-containing protein [Rhodocyclaceae bacterium]